MDWLKNFLAHPLAPDDADLDSPACTEARKRIILEGKFLKKVYNAWYLEISKGIPVSDGSIVEIGSGAGFYRDYLDSERLVTSDIIPLDDIDLVLDAQILDEKFDNDSLAGITMVNVLHHIPDVRRFFAAAERSLEQGGVISMIEPWVSGWSRVIYNNLHHEPFEPDREDWSFETSGPLSGSNQALPWIVFDRDREMFESEFPDLEVVTVRPIMPFRYLVSGGVSMRPLQPGWMYEPWRLIEKGLDPFRTSLAMFAHILVRKR